MKKENKLGKKLLALLLSMLMTVMTFGSMTVFAAGEITIPIMHTSDTHGWIVGEFNQATGDYDYRLAYLAKVFSNIEADKGEGIHTNGGDIFQGTPISSLNFQNDPAGFPVLEALQAMGLDAIAVGNHEFDANFQTVDGKDILDVMSEAGVRPLACNLKTDLAETGTFVQDARTDLYKIVTKQGKNIAIIGAVGNWISALHPSMMDHVQISDPAVAIQAVLQEPEVQAADACIVVAHMEFNEVKELAGKLDSSKVQVILGGHDHSWSNQSDGDQKVNGIVCLSGGANAQGYSYAELVFDDDSVMATNAKQVRITSKNEVADSDNLDAEVVQITKDAQQLIADKVAVVVGYSNEDIFRNVTKRKDPYDGEGVNPVPATESQLGLLAADAMREMLGTDLSVYLPGGLRADIPAGEINMGHMYSSFPFDHNLGATVTMTGAEYLSFISHGCEFSGITFKYDPNTGEYWDIKLDNGKKFDLNATYTVAGVDVIFGTVDGYPEMRDHNYVETYEDGVGISTRDWIVRYLKQLNTSSENPLVLTMGERFTIQEKPTSTAGTTDWYDNGTKPSTSTDKENPYSGGNNMVSMAVCFGVVLTATAVYAGKKRK